MAELGTVQQEYEKCVKCPTGQCHPLFAERAVGRLHACGVYLLYFLSFFFSHSFSLVSVSLAMSSGWLFPVYKLSICFLPHRSPAEDVLHPAQCHRRKPLFYIEVFEFVWWEWQNGKRRGACDEKAQKTFWVVVMCFNHWDGSEAKEGVFLVKTPPLKKKH